MSAKRIEWIDAAKGIATILVVSGHVWGGYTGKYGLPQYQALIDYIVYIIYTFHMPLFFILSGYVYGIKEINASKNELFGFVKKKALTLMVPYFITGVITVLIKLPFSYTTTYGYTWNDILLLPIKPVEQLWFLYVLFLCFCVKGLCEYKNIDGIWLPIILLIGDSALSLCGNSEFLILGQVFVKFCHFYIFFYIGVLARKKALVLNRWIAYVAAILFIVLSTLNYCVVINPFVKILIDIILSLSGSVVALYIAKSCKQATVSKILGVLGRYSMIIYLVHPVFCSILRRVMYMVGINNFVIHILVATLLALSVPILLQKAYKSLRMQLCVHQQ